MKIIIVGASGAVGKTAISALPPLHQIIRVGKSASEVQMDIENIDSICVMYRQVGKPHPVVRAIGQVQFGVVDEMSSEQFMEGINHKALPQFNLVPREFDYENDDGSFTVSRGLINRDPIRGGSCTADKGALGGFVARAAVDEPCGIRTNAVSPEVLESCRDAYDGFFPVHIGVSNEAVGLANSKAVEGCLNGQIIIEEY